MKSEKEWGVECLCRTTDKSLHLYTISVELCKLPLFRFDKIIMLFWTSEELQNIYNKGLSIVQASGGGVYR